MRVLKAELKGRFTHRERGGQQQLLGFFNQGLVNVLLGGLARERAQQVAQVGRRHVQGVGKMLHRGQGPLLRRREIVPQQPLEATEQVVLSRAPGKKLAVVEAVGVAEQHVELRNQHVLAESIDGPLVFQLQAVQQAVEHAFLLGRKVQRLVDLVGEKAVTCNFLGQGVLAQQVGVEDQHPAGDGRTIQGRVHLKDLPRGRKPQYPLPKVVRLVAIVQRPVQVALQENSVELRHHGVQQRRPQLALGLLAGLAQVD